MKEFFNYYLSAVFYLLYATLIGCTVYYIWMLTNLSLWGDELWTLSKIPLSFNLLLTPGYFNDPNYPTTFIFFKLVSLFLNSSDPDILLLANILNLCVMAFAFYLIRDLFTKEQILMLLAIIISNEYFIRDFFELKSSGLTLGFSSLFSFYYFKLCLKRDNQSFLGCFISGVLLSIIHPINGLFVCSAYVLIFYFSNSKFKKFFSILAFIFPIIFLRLYAVTYVENFHIELSFKHILNTGAFIIPILSLGLVTLIIQFYRQPNDSKEIFIFSLPIILSCLIILGYSVIVMPMYQARYFMSFIPLICIILIYYNGKDIKKLMLPLIIICILSVVFLYGPRAQVPHTNYKDLIEKSHSLECRMVPLFFNNPTTPVRDFYKETYKVASKLYSADFQRNLVTYQELVKNLDSLIDLNPSCEIIGITGQGKETVFVKNLEEHLNSKSNSSYKVTKSLADKCLKPGCGVIWKVNKE